MHNAKKLKQAYNLCTSNKKITQEERDYIYFYMAVRSVIYKFTKGDAPDATQMNARVRQLIEDALSSEGIEEVFKIKEPASLTWDEQNALAAVAVDLKLHFPVQVAAPMFLIANFHLLLSQLYLFTTPGTP